MAVSKRIFLLSPLPGTSDPGTGSCDDDEMEGSTKSPSCGPLAIAVLLFGVFIANADESFVMATYGAIASEFRRLSDGSWLMTGYTLGYCVSLPLYGRMGDLHDRKKLLLTTYFLFGLGCMISGTALSLWQTVLGRITAGVGGSGIAALISVIITDMVPLREVNVWRSYINVTAIVGRSCGGPIGGFLADTIGWRWSFLGQAPVALVCLLLAAWLLPSLSISKLRPLSDDDQSATIWHRFDILGTITFALSTTAFLLVLQLGGQKLPWGHPIVIVLAVVCFVLGVTFIATEWRAKAPLIPLSLLKSNGVGIFCGIQILVFISRWATLSSVPLYFIRTQDAENAVAAAYIVPTSIGNAMGAVIAGQIIKRTLRYKTLSIFSLALNILTYLLIALRWRHGTNVWEALYVFPWGLSHGMLVSTQFIGLSASAPRSRLATSISVFYLGQQLGIILGIVAAAVLLQIELYETLMQRLANYPNKEWIIENVLQDSRFASVLTDGIRSIVRSSYLYSFQFIPILSTCICVLLLPIMVILPERSLLQ
ncbi:hypothetical protein GJ744_001441 [Endocarpon pusillum]|uniref:Major facilitator superfamily (MFS) profile domain-containing protein n=1 Tax=Endocarpon pusillum TaxID=364733 RepID=A0A8H7AST1_9EURO|nr:hypothetical protein GJ744_001441 [Endocarpon pusillum]